MHIESSQFIIYLVNNLIVHVGMAHRKNNNAFSLYVLTSNTI